LHCFLCKINFQLFQLFFMFILITDAHNLKFVKSFSQFNEPLIASLHFQLLFELLFRDSISQRLFNQEQSFVSFKFFIINCIRRLLFLNILIKKCKIKF
jgi:hypothetical protein